MRKLIKNNTCWYNKELYKKKSKSKDNLKYKHMDLVNNYLKKKPLKKLNNKFQDDSIVKIKKMNKGNNNL